MNFVHSFLTLLVAVIVGAAGCLSCFYEVPYLRPIVVVPLAFAALTYLALRRERTPVPFNVAIKRVPVLRWLTLGVLPYAVLSLATPCCTGITAGLTRQTPHSTAVKRVEGNSTPVLVATQDLTRAETSPADEVWGLYNVGAVARATQQITETGK